LSFFVATIPEGIFDFNLNVVPTGTPIFIVSGTKSIRAFLNLSSLTQDWLFAARYQIQVGDSAFYVSDIPVIDANQEFQTLPSTGKFPIPRQTVQYHRKYETPHKDQPNRKCFGMKI